MTDVIIAKIKTLWFFRPAHYFVIKSLNIFFSNIFFTVKKKFSEVNVHPEIKWILCCSISSSVVVMQESFDKVLRCCSFASLTQKDAFPRISMTHYTGVHNWSSNDLSLDLWLVSSWSIRTNMISRQESCYYYHTAFMISVSNFTLLFDCCWRNLLSFCGLCSKLSSLLFCFKMKFCN